MLRSTIRSMESQNIKSMMKLLMDLEGPKEFGGRAIPKCGYTISGVFFLLEEEVNRRLRSLDQNDLEYHLIVHSGVEQ